MTDEEILIEQPVSAPGLARRCGYKGMWKGCARVLGHDGGHSTYPITDADLVANGGDGS